ncbi:MAG: hydrolase [Planctomycetota bacterium]|jgi:nicotinamidase-related amidase
MLDIKKCCLAVIDVQGRLAQLMYDKQTLFDNITILIQAARILNMPILWCQQSPAALGATVPQIAQLLTDNEAIDKSSFSCCGEAQFEKRLNSLSRRQVLLCGIEAHVCIYQTAVDLLQEGLHVEVVADAVSSRTLQNKELGINRMRGEGVKITGVEMALFELLRTAEHPQFKQIAKIIK